VSALNGHRQRLAFGVFFAAILLFFFFRGLEWRALAEAFRRANAFWLAAIVLATVVVYLLRAWRWGYLLAPLARVSLRDLFSMTMIGFAAGLVLPRAGEIVRPYLVGRRHGVRTSAAFASIIIERLLDLVTVLALFALYFFALPTPATQTKGDLIGVLQLAGKLMALVTGALLVLLWAFHAYSERALGIADRLLAWLPARLAGWIGSPLRSLCQGLAVLRAPGKHHLALLGQSLLLWLFIAFSLYCSYRAFGVDLPFHASFFLIGFLTVGVSIPTPGMVGGFHAFYLLALTRGFGVEPGVAAAAGIAAHALTNLPVLVLGLFFLSREGLSFGAMAQMTDTPGTAAAAEDAALAEKRENRP
jgi:glycosyltransferase 2 family protein